MKTPSQIKQNQSRSSLNKKRLTDRILTVRGQKVILDYELAEFFNCNIDVFRKRITQINKKFDEQALMIRLTKADLEQIPFQKVEPKKRQSKTWQDGVPQYAFTEQGVSILIMFLSGEVVIRQNHDLAIALKEVECYLRESQETDQQLNNTQPMEIVLQAANEISSINLKLAELERRMETVENRNDLIDSPTDLPLIYTNCKDTLEKLGTVFLGGEPMRASRAYMDIYNSAEKSIYILDNYASIKTLWHLDGIKPGVRVIIFSDNLENSLHNVDFVDFKRERPHTDIKLIRTMERLHDRFIVIDVNEKTEVIYHCGTSEKDAGHKIAAISKLEDETIKDAVRTIVAKMLTNKALKLK